MHAIYRHLPLSTTFPLAVRAEGVGALYKGATAHFLRVGPHTIVTLLLLERMQQLLGVAPPAGSPGGAAASAAAQQR